MSMPHIFAVHRSPTHTLAKPSCTDIQLLEGLGVEGDAHMGTTVKHRSRVARDPNQPNLRQVHLITHELLQALAAQGMPVAPGQMGENITTVGIDLIDLPAGTLLHLGAEAVVEVTGLRNPCHQLESIHAGLMAAVLDRAPDGSLVRKLGVMGVVRKGGRVDAGASIVVELPMGEHLALGVV
jgi:MOSC domain-containing protein YiiM